MFDFIVSTGEEVLATFPLIIHDCIRFTVVVCPLFILLAFLVYIISALIDYLRR